MVFIDGKLKNDQLKKIFDKLEFQTKLPIEKQGQYISLLMNLVMVPLVIKNLLSY